MKEFKASPEDVSRMSAGARLLRLRWWFVLLLILGVLAAGYVVLRQIGALKAAPVQENVQAASVLGLVVPVYYTQPGSEGSAQPMNPRPYIMLVVFAVLAVVLLAGVFTQLTSKDEDKVDKAGDLVKTLLGFFIGVATSYIGGA